MPKTSLKTLDPHAGRKPGRRGNCLFKQRDVERLLRAAKNEDRPNARVEVYPDGRLSLVPAELARPSQSDSGGVNPWDEVLTNATDEERAS